ncbi:MAG: dihydroneopterin aldolase [Vulcanimicrobiaceae bacterium]
MAPGRLERRGVTDRIAVRGIRAYGKHGANAGERDFVQAFDIEIELDVDLATARVHDTLEDTIDYAALHARVVALVAARSYLLLERLGDEILRDVMCDARIAAATVTIAKPRLLDGATPSVRIAATRA